MTLLSHSLRDQVDQAELKEDVSGVFVHVFKVADDAEVREAKRTLQMLRIRMHLVNVSPQ